MADTPALLEKTLNIIIAIDTFLPVTKAGGIQMRDLAEALVQFGHHVTVLTPDPYLSSVRVESCSEVTVVRVPSGQTKEIALTRRAINEFLLPGRLWWAFRKIPASAGTIDVFIMVFTNDLFGTFGPYDAVALRCRDLSHSQGHLSRLGLRGGHPS
jgi:hypothetical protein